MMMMRLFCLLIFASLTALPAANCDQVRDAFMNSTCSKCADMKMTKIPNCYSFLEVVFESNPQDRREIGLATINLVLQNASTIERTIKDMIYSGSSDRSALQQCLDIYEAVTNKLREAWLDVFSGAYKNVEEDMKLVSERVELCDAMFQGSGKASPLVKENDNLKELSNIVTCSIKFGKLKEM